ITTLMWATNQFSDSSSTVNYIAAFTLAIFPLIDSFIAVNQGVSESSFYEDSIVRLNDLPEPTLLQETRHTTNSAVINFNQVTFKYGDKTIVDNLSFEVQPKEKIALLGRSGAGKTTLLKLLAGDIQSSLGEVTIDETPVQNLQGSMSSLVAVLDQQAYLFDTAIMNNVRMGNIHATDEQVQKAIKQAGLQPLINSLPNGYYTQMQEAGTRFSGGERQRFALARIMLQD
ncbi:MAG: ATP-binding cassette domain-containing protein, partial [Leuconostoc falkenbergense]